MFFTSVFSLLGGRSSSRELPVNDVDFAYHIENMLRDITDESDTIDDSDADLVYVQKDEYGSNPEDW